MRRLALAILFTIVFLPDSLAGQQRTPPQPRRGPPVIKIAKWSLLGLAGGLGLYALQHSTAAEDAYADLRSLCLAAPQRCEREGRPYDDPEAEGLYRRAVSEDRRAQLGIFGGQAMLFGSVGLFIYDLRDDRTPRTIPYPGSASRATFVLATVVF
jgi:hypothetical protein